MIVKDAPYVIVAGDGRFAAVVDRGRIAVLQISDGTLAGEYAIANGAQVAWLGSPSRLLVISPGPGYQTAQLIDPDPTPSELGEPVPEDETRVEATSRLAATVDDYALLLGAQGATLLQALGMKLALSRFLTLTVPSVAGTAGRRFVVAIGGTIEEWDPKQRAATRRVRLRIPVHNEITAVGGSDRRFWMITRDTPSRIDVIVDVNRGKPDAYDLPEPIASVARHPQRELLACIGRDTGRLYVLSLDGQLATRTVTVEGLDAIDSVAFCPGQTVAMVAARTGKPVMIVGLDGKPLGAAPAVQAGPAASSPRPPVRAVDDVEPPPRARPRVADEREPREPTPPAPAPDALSARSASSRSSHAEHDAQLERLRRVVVATVERALARDLASDTPGGDADDAVSDELRDARAALAQGTTALDLVCRDHEVDAIGAQVLLYVAAPALWGELARRYTVLANDPSRAVCDEHLLVQLLGDTFSRRELARALDPDAPLVRHGLVRVGERARPFQPLSADPIVVKLLAGDELGGDEPGIHRVDLDVPLDRVVAPPDVIERALADLAAAPAGRARVVVRGRTGSGRTTLLAALARHAGRSLAMIDVAPLVRDQRLCELSLLLLHANLRGWLPCVDGLDAIASDDAAARSVIRDVIRDHHGPVAVRLPHYLESPIEPDHVLVDLPSLSRTERAEQWRSALAEHGRTVRDLDALASRFVVGTGTIRRVAAIVARAAERDTDRAVDSAMRQHLAARLPAMATRVTQLASWTDVVLPGDVQNSIGELVARIRHRHTVFEAWGFDRLMTAPRGVTALLQGERGTGKTLVAGAIANDLGVDLYRIDLAGVLPTWSGETEQNLGKVFDAAEQAQAVLLLEQADVLVEKRAGGGERDVALAYLVQRFDACDGVVILTVNDGTAIDEPVARRVSAQVTLPFPDEAARERLWRVHLPDDLPVRGTLDLAALARQNQMSGGGIRDAALRAAFLAAAEGSPIAQEHLERAVRSELFETADR